MDLSLISAGLRALFAAAILLNVLIVQLYHRRAAAPRIIVIERRNSTAHFIVKSMWGPSLYGVLFVALAKPEWIAWASIEVPALLRWLGAALALGSLPFTLWTNRTLGHNLAGALEVSLGWELVTVGPYRRIRHPLYLAGTAFLAGLTLLSANLLVAGVSAAGILLMRFVAIPREERTLAETYGREFEAYRNGTGVWCPVRRRSGRGKADSRGADREPGRQAKRHSS